MDALDAGAVVAGRYAIVRPLGRGASKQVYLAHDRLNGTPVALSFLHGEHAGDATIAARFSREARAASALRSPYVVRVHDAAKLADGTRFLVTEAVLGRGLDEAMRDGAVAPSDAVRWTLHVLSALAEAHGRGILHRDVKPENVLLAPGTDGETAKLTDFGLAKVLDIALEGSVVLQTGHNVLLGTPEYMAPEQWRGGPLDARADLYSVGVMLYEMLVGRPPFRAPVLHALCLAHLTAPVPDFGPEAPPDARALEPLVRRALAKEPSARFASADAMLAALAERAAVAPPPRSVSPPAVRAAYPRAELLCEAWPGPVALLATPVLVLGRDADADVVLRCLPSSPEQDARTRTVSRRHATLELRDGAFCLRDLGGATGTSVDGVRIPEDGYSLATEVELGIGPHVRLRFVRDPSARAAWARLERVDPWGNGQIWVLVVGEIRIGGGPHAAVRLPTSAAAGDELRIRPGPRGFDVLTLGAPTAVVLGECASLRVGSLRISVAARS